MRWGSIVLSCMIAPTAVSYGAWWGGGRLVGDPQPLALEVNCSASSEHPESSVAVRVAFPQWNTTTLSGGIELILAPSRTVPSPRLPRDAAMIPGKPFNITALTSNSTEQQCIANCQSLCDETTACLAWTVWTKFTTSSTSSPSPSSSTTTATSPRECRMFDNQLCAIERIGAVSAFKHRSSNGITNSSAAVVCTATASTDGGAGQMLTLSRGR